MFLIPWSMSIRALARPSAPVPARAIFRTISAGISWAACFSLLELAALIRRAHDADGLGRDLGEIAVRRRRLAEPRRDGTGLLDGEGGVLAQRAVREHGEVGHVSPPRARLAGADASRRVLDTGGEEAREDDRAVRDLARELERLGAAGAHVDR